MRRTKSEYPILLRKLSEAEGGGYLAEFPDLPGCIADGATPEEALLESQDALKSYLASVKKHADKLPAPTESVWRQRAPKSLHHRLQVEAEREGVSFNTLVISMLSEGLGRKTAHTVRRKAGRKTSKVAVQWQPSPKKPGPSSPTQIGSKVRGGRASQLFD
jgi:antitoxin HicB